MAQEFSVTQNITCKGAKDKGIPFRLTQAELNLLTDALEMAENYQLNRKAECDKSALTYRSKYHNTRAHEFRNLRSRFM
jgi:hypothetical protein